jgi:hypothetical protein
VKELTGAPGIRSWVDPRCGVGIVGTIKLVTFGNLIAKFVQSMAKTEWDTHIEGRMDGKSEVWLLYILHRDHQK